MTVGVHDVASLVITHQANAGEPVDKLQLEKLVAIIQGVHLAFWDEPAFREPVHAYRNGPVVKPLEATYREVAVGRAPIERPLGGRPDRLSAEVADTVLTVLRHFGSWPGPALEAYLKKPGSPWRQVREAAGLPDGAPSDIEIPGESLAAWFRRIGIAPNPPRVRPMEPTAAEEKEAAERRDAARFAGVYGAPTAAFEEAVRRSLAKIADGPAS